MRRLVALLATTARAQTPRRVHGFDVRTKAGHAFKCLDAFIAPAPWNASAPALVGICHPGHRQLTWAGGRCGFRYASTEMDARVAREAGHEVFACAVPPTEQLDGKFLGARITDGDHDNAISVTASTWPWRQRSKTYGVAVTFMGKNVACGLNKGFEAHCFRDWLEWHRLLGVDHFVAYDNGSRGDHAWLRVARHYARRGLLTLVDWPYQLGGEGTTGNNVAQRAQLSHAAFAFSPRVAWLGTFDVDEFFVRVGVENHGSI